MIEERARSGERERFCHPRGHNYERTSTPDYADQYITDKDKKNRPVSTSACCWDVKQPDKYKKKQKPKT